MSNNGKHYATLTLTREEIEELSLAEVSAPLASKITQERDRALQRWMQEQINDVLAGQRKGRYV